MLGRSISGNVTVNDLAGRGRGHWGSSDGGAESLPAGELVIV